MTNTDVKLLLLTTIQQAERIHPTISFRLRMREAVFRKLAENNYQAHKETRDFHYAGKPVILDNNIPETNEGEDFTSNIFVEPNDD